MKFRIVLFLFSFVFITILLLNACKKTDTAAPFKPTYLQLQIPAGWPQPVDIFANNPLTEEGFQLGRKLFYDGQLSKDGHYPCSSCHQQVAAFGIYDHDFGHGYNNGHTFRNPPVLFNLAWMQLLRWDGAINNLELAPRIPITAPNEMGENIDSVLIKLRTDTAYPRLFKSAFGSTDISSQRMYKALAQFTGSIISTDSKYDKYKRGEANFTPAELNGYNLFKAKCETCHKEPLFTDNSLRNTGLANTMNDNGRMRVTNNRNDSLKFKVPSLRNIVASFPYMHDGRLYTLGQVIDHYRTGIITTQPTLDPLLVNRISITGSEKNDLLNFLFTLSDTAFVKNSRFGPY